MYGHGKCIERKCMQKIPEVYIHTLRNKMHRCTFDTCVTHDRCDIHVMHMLRCIDVHIAFSFVSHTNVVSVYWKIDILKKAMLH